MTPNAAPSRGSATAPATDAASPALIVAPAAGVALDVAAKRRVPAVALVGGVVAGWGTLTTLRRHHPNAAPLTDGAVALPGFRDPHVHLLRLASASAAIDCDGAVVASIPALLARLHAGAARLPRGAWVRAAGYDHRALAERRHPHRDELDRAVPDRPLVLRHRSGHASVLNSCALRRLALDGASTGADAADRLERDERGAPTGLLIAGDALLRTCGLPLLEADVLQRAVADASHELARTGVTWLCDAGVENDGATRALFERLAAAGRLRQRWALLQGVGPFLAGGARRDDGFAGVKLVVDSGSGSPAPEPDALERQLDAIDAAGMPAAVHAVEPDELVVALTAFERLFARRGRGTLRHRIEHASACPPELAAWIARLGLVVVTQPAFVEAFGDRYLDAGAVPADWLYPCRTLHDAGVVVAASSDAPFGPSDPLAAVRAAVRRRARDGREVGGAQRLSLAEALSLHAVAAVATEPGGLRRGGPADVVVLDRDPLALDADALGARLVRTTIAAGRIVFKR